MRLIGYTYPMRTTTRKALRSTLPDVISAVASGDVVVVTATRAHRPVAVIISPRTAESVGLLPVPPAQEAP